MHWKTRKFIANLLALCGKNRTRRRQIRDKILFHNFIQSINNDNLVYPSQSEKYTKKINVCFCFDEKGYKIASVAIKSLLEVSKNKCDYNIYCVIDKKLSSEAKKQVKQLVQNTKSKIILLNANHDFDKSYLAKWPVSIYYRTMLPKLLPNVDKIIYADIDIIFCNSLVEADLIGLGNNYIAGVKAHNNTYINSGFLIMNLKQIRKDGLYQKWIYESQNKQYPNPDQDLLNYTCTKKIVYLPLKYNFQPMDGSDIFKNHTPLEIQDIKYHLNVLHFSNWMKPWHDKDKRPIYSEYWWKYALQTKFFKPDKKHI